MKRNIKIFKCNIKRIKTSYIEFINQDYLMLSKTNNFIRYVGIKLYREVRYNIAPLLNDLVQDLETEDND